MGNELKEFKRWCRDTSNELQARIERLQQLEPVEGLEMAPLRNQLKDLSMVLAMSGAEVPGE